MSEPPKKARKALTPAHAGTTTISGEPDEVTTAPRSLHAGGHDDATRTFVAVGSVLSNHYRMVRELGRGGMGVVFEAEDLKLEGRRVAVKVLPPELAHEAAAAVRLQREAAAVAALDHPNIVRLHEYNDDEGIHYVVMELLDGKNLAVYLAERATLPLDEVVAIARVVASALDFAHERNIIHRDVKPSNLLFKGDDADGVVKVADFGIAHQVRDSVTRATGRETAGTLLYLAPEQLRGKKASPASDQYSLAVTCYELLAGDPPFTGRGVTHQIIEGEPEPLPGLPEAANAALLKALAKQPDERFPSCAAFVDALEGRGGAAVMPRTDADVAPTRTGAWGYVTLFAVLAVAAFAVVQSGGPGASLLPAPVTATPVIPTPTTLPTEPTTVAEPTPVPSIAPAPTTTSAEAVVAVTVPSMPPPPPPAAPEFGSVYVASRPPGAAIAVDGKETGLTTDRVLPDLPAGDRTISVAKPDYEPAERTVLVAPGPVQRAEFDLVPRLVRLLVESVPDGATVTIDGVRQPAVCPVDLPAVSCSTHAMVLEKAGWRWAGTVVVTEKLRHFRQAMEPLAVDVKFTSTPSGAVVQYADGSGRRIGTTPCSGTVSPGRHRFRFTLGGHRPTENELVVEPGKPGQMKAALEAMVATLVLEGIPAGATVTVNGKPLDAAVWGKARLAPGTYGLRVECPDSEPFVRQLQLADRQVLEIPVNLVPKPRGPLVFVQPSSTAVPAPPSPTPGTPLVFAPPQPFVEPVVDPAQIEIQVLELADELAILNVEVRKLAQQALAEPARKNRRKSASGGSNKSRARLSMLEQMQKERGDYGSGLSDRCLALHTRLRTVEQTIDRLIQATRSSPSSPAVRLCAEGKNEAQVVRRKLTEVASLMGLVLP